MIHHIVAVPLFTLTGSQTTTYGVGAVEEAYIWSWIVGDSFDLRAIARGERSKRRH